MMYVNAHIDTKKSKPLSDVSVFLPHPSEYREARAGNVLALKPDTARIILAYRGLVKGRASPLLEEYMDEIYRIAAK
jgi:hypothetical protein